MRRADHHASLDERRMKMIARANEILASYRDQRPEMSAIDATDLREQSGTAGAMTESFDAMSRNVIED